MSLSWLDRLSLHLTPQRVVFERQPWRGAARRQVIDLAAPASGEPDWQPALAGVQAAFTADGERGGSLRVTVADHFVRYTLLPWSELAAGQGARRAMAQALLRDALGEKAAQLELALDRPRFRSNGLAVGVDKALLAGVRNAAKARRMRVDSLQPRLTQLLDQYRKTLHQADGWVVCIDRERLSLAGLKAGKLVCVRNHRSADAGELPGLLIADRPLVGGTTVYWHAADGRLPALGAEWQVVPLTGEGARA